MDEEGVPYFHHGFLLRLDPQGTANRFHWGRVGLLQCQQKVRSRLQWIPMDNMSLFVMIMSCLIDLYMHSIHSSSLLVIHINVCIICFLL